MTLGRISGARTPLSLTTQQLTLGISRNQSSISGLQEQVSSGQRYRLPGEAPAQAVQTISLQSLIERKVTVQESLTQNIGYASTSEAALAVASDSLIRARSLAQEGIGDTSSDAERQGQADEVLSLIHAVTNAANTNYQGRFLFGGTTATTSPFTRVDGGAIRYGGDDGQIDGFVDLDLLQANNLNGATAYRAITTAVASDLNPALTLSTKLAALQNGVGIERGIIEVEVSNGSPIKKLVDLSDADSIADIKTRIEAAFAAESITVTVAIDTGSNAALTLTPSAGTIRVADPLGTSTAAQLGISSTATAAVVGRDVHTSVTELTTVASLNGGTGIGATTGTGLRIVNGSRVSVVDLNGATTVGEVINRLRTADPDLYVRIDNSPTGLAISSRLNGVDFSIGENGGTNATLLGVRTLRAETALADLNRGVGVPLDEGPLTITRRDGTTSTISLVGKTSISDVLSTINGVSPGVLVAGLNATGNGISLTDSSGAGTLTVVDGPAARALGIVGSEATGATGVLAGTDVNPQETGGGFDLLIRLERALRTNNNSEISRLTEKLDAELARTNVVRGEIGSRQKLFEDLKQTNADLEVNLRANLSEIFDTDLTTAITQLRQQQSSLEASLQVSSRSFQLSLLNYL